MTVEDSNAATNPSAGGSNTGRQANPGKRQTGGEKKFHRPRKGNSKKKNSEVTAPRDEMEERQTQQGKKNNGQGRPSKKPGKRAAGRKKNANTNKNKSSGNLTYPPYWSLDDCLARYNAKDPNIIRGSIRILPMKDAMAFCTCDRGSQKSDVLLEGPLERNRTLDGDTVFVELLPIVLEEKEQENDHSESGNEDAEEEQASATTSGSGGSLQEQDDDELWWQDDPMQMNLWAPTVPIQRTLGIADGAEDGDNEIGQRKGRVVHVVPPKAFYSEIHPTQRAKASFKRIVGTLKRLPSGTTLLTCSSKSMPQFRLSTEDAKRFKDARDNAIFQAKYTYGSWKESFNWPPCSDVVQFGESCNIDDETTALLIDNQVDHGEFPASVLEECQNVVSSGEYTSGTESGWKPTPEMYEGRRDYRNRRIFTIDPTTAKDLDDALHVEDLGNGQVEIGVHIADVSFFIDQDSHLDLEARRRCTTVYLVDRTIPMLPRPLCEIACSLNENVERLAFSCVWRMNLDGSMVKGHNAWYGRSVIKSCARLDYSTAQNIIENQVAFGENEVDENLWPKSRRPTGSHTIDQVAADVRLMNKIAQARRSLRFQNGALALNSVKLTFQLDGDGETPLLCKPYEIRDSNRLVEEYMLLANYLVAERLITHAGGRACLRSHATPLSDGLKKVAEVAKEAIGFDLDISSSEGLQRSLSRLGRQCRDDLVLKCVTEMLKVPMKPATYVAAGTVPSHAWAHFALNIPYYTHFTSPIRRYADVIVHRLLQATLDGNVDDFKSDEKQINQFCDRCNDKKEGSRKAQERSDTVFLALYLKRHPLKSQLGVVLSVGQKTFTVFLPNLGISAMVFLDEHKDWIQFEDNTVAGHDRRIKLQRTCKHKGETWKELVVKTFCKIRVTCNCQEKPPVSVKLVLEGPWLAEE